MCGECPARGRLPASMWTLEQPRKLNWVPSAFPPFWLDFSPYRGLVSTDDTDSRLAYFELRSIESRIMPVIQWLFEPGKGDVKSISVDDDFKRSVFNKLQDSYIYRNAERLRNGMKAPVDHLTQDYIFKLVQSLGTGIMSQGSAKTFALVLDRWINFDTGKAKSESQLDEIVEYVIHLVAKEEGFTHLDDYLVNKHIDTRHKLYICGEELNSECDVELIIRKPDANGGKGSWSEKVLCLTENKASYSLLRKGFPQMVCQCTAAARNALFSTEDHHILYGVSLFGTEGVLLSRAHIWKGLTERPSECLFKEPDLQKSYMFFDSCVPAEKKAGKIDVGAIVILFLAFKGLFLLQSKFHQT
ncbi:uncharacterized protein [Ptychodera flava]|uniref:uncharacterized protein n=1 Tax=Ptychodera flava TaxID=63121 RepID=UPI00396A47C3